MYTNDVAKVREAAIKSMKRVLRLYFENKNVEIDEQTLRVFSELLVDLLANLLSNFIDQHRKGILEALEYARIRLAQEITRDN